MADEPITLTQFLALKDNFVIGRMITPDPDPAKLPAEMGGEVWMQWPDRTVMNGSYYNAGTNTFTPPADAPAIGVPPEELPTSELPPPEPTKHVSAAAIAAGGNGYVIADTITLSHGVTLAVTAEVAGAVDTVSIQTPGSAVVDAVPTNPVAQLLSSGGGLGATFNLTWIDTETRAAPKRDIHPETPPPKPGRYINAATTPSGRR